MLGENVLDALERIGARRRRQLPLHDGNLVGLAFAEIDDSGCRLLTNVDPIGADKGGGRIARAHVDLYDVDPRCLRLLQQLCVCLDVRIVDHNHVRLFGDEVGRA